MTEVIHWPIDDLPKTCIYSIEENYYTQFYEMDEVCMCGNNNWHISMLTMNVFESQIALPPKHIQRCSLCNEIRLCKLKKIYVDIIQQSKNFLETLKSIYSNKMSKPEDELLYVLKNMTANLELKIKNDELKKNNDKVISVKKFFEENKIDEPIFGEMLKKMSQEKSCRNM